MASSDKSPEFQRQIFPGGLAWEQLRSGARPENFITEEPHAKEAKDGTRSIKYASHGALAAARRAWWVRLCAFVLMTLCHAIVSWRPISPWVALSAVPRDRTSREKSGYWRPRGFVLRKAAG